MNLANEECANAFGGVRVEIHLHRQRADTVGISVRSDSQGRAGQLWRDGLAYFGARDNRAQSLQAPLTPGAIESSDSTGDTGLPSNNTPI